MLLFISEFATFRGHQPLPTRSQRPPSGRENLQEEGRESNIAEFEAKTIFTILISLPLFCLAQVGLDAGIGDAVHNEPLQVAAVGHPHQRDRRSRRLRAGGQGSNYGLQGRRRQVGCRARWCTFSTCHLNDTLSVAIHDALLSAKGPEGHNNRSVVFLGKETAERGDGRKEEE